ncbi:MAG: ABC transporter ATP-binding protein [Magnetococcales bacterium]|nr:ABC transporter ATP-binding protein [Magnetococcales bacterium]
MTNPLPYRSLLRPQWRFILMVNGYFALSAALDALALILLEPLLLSQDAGKFHTSLLAHTLLSHLRPFIDNLPLLSLLAFAGCKLLAIFMRMLAETRVIQLRIRIEKACRLEVTRKLLSMEWPHYLSLRQGDIGYAINMEGGQIGEGVNAIATCLGMFTETLVYLGASFLLAPELASCMVFFGVLGALLYHFGSRKSRQVATVCAGHARELGEHTAEMFGHLKFLRASGLSGQAHTIARDVISAYATTLERLKLFQPRMRSLFEASAFLFIGLFIGWFVIVEKLPFASVLILLAIFYRIVPRLIWAHDFWLQATNLQPWFHSWQARNTLAATHRQPADGDHLLPAPRSIAFQEVAFHYPQSPQPALRDLSLQLHSGECVALVGASGSGKSTLIDLILGLLHPSGGTVAVDGIPLKKLNLEAWQHRIGLVMQETPIFHSTILENIALGDAHPDPEKARTCALQAQAWEFIEKLPQGMQTLVGERGSRLSGGQRQRIAIARALYRSPWLLLLDEPTSALDSLSESQVHASLDALRHQTSMLLVTHRINTARIADRILVLQEGRIVESGSWQELMQRPGGIFQQLAASQGL